MNVVILKTFASDFENINNASFKEKLKSVIQSLETSSNISNLTPIQTLQESDKFFKMAIGLYYLLIKSTATDTLALVRVVHRDQLRQSLNKSI